MGLKKFRDLGTRSGVPRTSTLWSISTITDIFRQSLRAHRRFRKSGNVSKDRYAYPKPRDSHSSTPM